MHPNVERVAAALRDGDASGEIRELADSTRTADEAAAALAVPVGAIVKSLVFTADGQPVMVLASGDHQVDTAAVATALGVGKVRRADADTVRAATGYPIGGVPPVAHSTELRILLDHHLIPTLPAIAYATAGFFPFRECLILFTYFKV